MHFFPYLTEAFESPLPPAELLRRVAASLAAQPAAEFEGSVGPDSFVLKRLIDYRNSMLPRIDGWVAAGPAGGSRLRLRHQLHPAVLAFALFWLFGVGSVVVGVVPLLFRGSLGVNLRALDWPDAIPLGMLAVGVLLFTVPFWLEVRQSRPRLIRLLSLQATARR